ncbi:hypothetical protein EDB89DRAFT_802387 [Lactarius sanguifluus]|nr:hypothetical protein EDB89DRAFT_802387 [Lactarius sanguifluus]
MCKFTSTSCMSPSSSECTTNSSWAAWGSDSGTASSVAVLGFAMATMARAATSSESTELERERTRVRRGEGVATTVFAPEAVRRRVNPGVGSGRFAVPKRERARVRCGERRTGGTTGRARRAVCFVALRVSGSACSGPGDADGRRCCLVIAGSSASTGGALDSWAT